MTSAPSAPFPVASTAPPVAEAVPAAWSSQQIRPIAIVTPDELSAALLLEYAAPLFPAEVVPGSQSVVRLQPPPAQGRWVLELLSLMGRWLESAGLPSALVVYGGRSYVIRAPTELAA